MVIECLELCIPLYNKEKYIEIVDVIIPNMIGNYNEILPIKVHQKNTKNNRKTKA